MGSGSWWLVPALLTAISLKWLFTPPRQTVRTPLQAALLSTLVFAILAVNLAVWLLWVLLA